MTNTEQTERMAIAMIEKLPDAERKRLFRCKRELEKVLRNYGPLGLMAYGVLAAELSGGRKPGEVKIVVEELPPESGSVEKPVEPTPTTEDSGHGAG